MIYRASWSAVERTLLLGLLFVSAFPVASASETTESYRTPSPALVALVDAAASPVVELSPGRKLLLILERPNLPPISDLAERELRLAGWRINPLLSARSRPRPSSGLQLVDIATGETRPVGGLNGAMRIENLEWSPDGGHVSFSNRTAEQMEIWVMNVAAARAWRLTDRPLHLVAGEGPRWVDNTTLLCALVPEDRAAEPAEPRVPQGPIVQESLGEIAPTRTYQDLLRTPHDEVLFEHYARAQLARVSLGGRVTKLGEPLLLFAFDSSPDGQFVRVEHLHRPFSYLVPASRFPRRVEIWSASGTPVETLVDRPLQESVPITFGSVTTGPRDHEWRSDQPATIVWSEALDGGDAGAEAELRDRLFTLAAPFSGAPRALATLGLRHANSLWGDGEMALIGEWWWKTRQVRVWRVWPDHPERAPVLFDERSFEDRYADPGDPLRTRDARGRERLLTIDGKLLLVGDGASPEGDRPFLDARPLEGSNSMRQFRSEAPCYERPIHILDEQGRVLLTRRESVGEPPNYFVRDLDAGTLRPLTAFAHPTPQLLGASKEQIRYQRSDGVELTATLYLPPGYTPEQGPLPLLMWAYPQEFKSADAAGQVTDSPYRFVRTWWGSPLVWLAAGYAVLDDPTLPIVGEGDVEPNDTYVEQLVAGARAAVDEVVRRGVTEPGRIAIGGHSYGAFMTANLLAHSDLFATGIARSGAYNRTLTPFGFQAEERTVWQAPEVYTAMSPFLHAEKVDEPILLIHGEADNNSGTFPMQSERFYAALKGLGGRVRLVMLPLESHGYQGRESVLHMLWETERWLDTYLRRGSPPSAP